MTFPRCLTMTFFMFLVVVNLCEETHAGPLSLSFARSFRSGREIRTPFKSPGIMVARGFGKRNNKAMHSITAPVPIITDKDNTSNDAGKLIVSPTALAGNSLTYGIDDDFDTKRVAIDELLANPNMARFVLQRFLDANGDGWISAHELSAYPFESIEYY